MVKEDSGFGVTAIGAGKPVINPSSSLVNDSENPRGCTCFQAGTQARSSTRIRVYFGIFLVIGYIICILSRNAAFGALKSVSMVRGDCSNGAIKSDVSVNLCVGNFAAYRVSAGNFVFFAILLFLSSRAACCCSAHCLGGLQAGFWLLKTVGWVLCIVVPFLIPSSNDVFYGYAWASAVGSGFFLLIQILILVDFGYTWSESWMEKEDKKWQYGLLFCTFAMYCGALIFIILSYVWFKGEGCGMYTTFTTITLVVAFLMTLATLRLEHASLVPTAVIVLYCSYLNYSALRSGAVQECNANFDEWPQTGIEPSVVVGVLVVGISLFYSAVSSGSKGHVIVFHRPNGDSEEDPTCPATYFFSHLVMALASMYMAMLVSGWTISKDTTDWSTVVDTGVPAMWVKIVTEWVCLLLYFWTLIAPVVCKDRFSVD